MARRRTSKATSDSTSQSQSQTLSQTGNFNKSNKSALPEVTPPANPPNLPSKDDEWDKFFKNLDHEAEEEAPSSSMISFVMRNLTVGMDLSRMPLPTWFLQKRSILESYSDFFRHADEFVKIAKAPTAEARMVQCFRWFMIGFNDHFHKLKNIAKKPFNSIIGETFTGEFKIGTSSQEKSTNSPWPWMSTHNLLFTAEQVSHHPPISAFYVECPANRISASCYIRVIAKFRGLHIKVKNLGSLTVNLHDLGEEYIFTFPDGFGRSLLTTPWVEAGGHGTISCAKTGFNTDIEFFTKSMFSSERNKIIAKMSGPKTASPKDATIYEGHWDQQISKTSGQKNAKDALLVDMSQQPVLPFVHRHFSHLPDNDSRKVWRDVAWCIENKLQEKANEFKAYVENVQRREQALRDQRDIKWKARLFRCIPNTAAKKKDTHPDPWEFIEPLSKRGNAKPVTSKTKEQQQQQQPQQQQQQQQQSSVPITVNRSVDASKNCYEAEENERGSVLRGAEGGVEGGNESVELKDELVDAGVGGGNESMEMKDELVAMKDELVDAGVGRGNGSVEMKDELVDTERERGEMMVGPDRVVAVTDAVIVDDAEAECSDDIKEDSAVEVLELADADSPGMMSEEVVERELLEEVGQSSSSKGEVGPACEDVVEPRETLV